MQTELLDRHPTVRLISDGIMAHSRKRARAMRVDADAVESEALYRWSRELQRYHVGPALSALYRGGTVDEMARAVTARLDALNERDVARIVVGTVRLAVVSAARSASRARTIATESADDDSGAAAHHSVMAAEGWSDARALAAADRLTGGRLTIGAQARAILHSFREDRLHAVAFRFAPNNGKQPRQVYVPYGRDDRGRLTGMMSTNGPAVVRPVQQGSRRQSLAATVVSEHDRLALLMPASDLGTWMIRHDSHALALESLRGWSVDRIRASITPRQRARLVTYAHGRAYALESALSDAETLLAEPDALVYACVPSRHRVRGSKPREVIVSALSYGRLSEVTSVPNGPGLRLAARVVGELLRARVDELRDDGALPRAVAEAWHREDHERAAMLASRHEHATTRGTLPSWYDAEPDHSDERAAAALVAGLLRASGHSIDTRSAMALDDAGESVPAWQHRMSTNLAWHADLPTYSNLPASDHPEHEEVLRNQSADWRREHGASDAWREFRAMLARVERPVYVTRPRGDRSDLAVAEQEQALGSRLER